MIVSNKNNKITIEQQQKSAEIKWRQEMHDNWDSRDKLQEMYMRIQDESEYPQHVYGPNKFTHAPYLLKIDEELSNRILELQILHIKSQEAKIITLAKIAGVKKMLSFIKHNRVDYGKFFINMEDYDWESSSNNSNSISKFCEYLDEKIFALTSIKKKDNKNSYPYNSVVFLRGYILTYSFNLKYIKNKIHNEAFPNDKQIKNLLNYLNKNIGIKNLSTFENTTDFVCHFDIDSPAQLEEIKSLLKIPLVYENQEEVVHE